MTGRAGSLPAALPGTPKHPQPCLPPAAGGPGRCPRSPACHIRALVLPSPCAPAGSTAGFGGVTRAGAGVLPALGGSGSLRVGWRCSWLGWSLGRGCCGVAIPVESWLLCGWRWLCWTWGSRMRLWALTPAWGVTLGGCLFERGLLGDCASAAWPIWVCTDFCRGLCDLFGVTVGWWLGQPCPTPAVSPHPPWPPKSCSPPAALLPALGMV